jgi:DNA-directed RNA polymerase subunit RPC12/RpoP
MQTLKLVCPKCKKNLSLLLNGSSDVSRRKISCKSCGYVGYGSEFMQSSSKNYHGDGYNVPDTDGTENEELETEIYTKSNDIATDMGQIREIETGKTHKLEFGTNILGREAKEYEPNKKPTLPIKTADKKMSRAHARIDVEKSPHGGYIFKMEDTSKNGITVKGQKIPKSSVIYLSFGNIMIWGRTKVIFEAANGTETGGDDTEGTM